MKYLLTIIVILLAVNAWAADQDTLATQEITRDGITPSFTAVSDDTMLFYCPANYKAFIEVKNTNAATRTVQVVSTIGDKITLPIGTAASNAVDTVAATTGDKMMGPYPAGAFADDNNYIMVIFSAIVNVSWKPFILQ